MPFTSEDGALSVGFLYSKGTERGVICITHPRGGLERHYMIPSMIEAGFAVFSFNHRMRTDDFDLVHETLLLDIAGAVTMMKAGRGYDRVLLFGNSGGGGPLGYYQWQAEASPPNRFTHTPAGDELDLNTFELPPAEGFILLAAGFGESVHVSRWIDPSVIDETDPRLAIPSSTCTAAGMATGSHPPRAPIARSSGSATATAQAARVARIDAYDRVWRSKISGAIKNR